MARHGVTGLFFVNGTRQVVPIELEVIVGLADLQALLKSQVKSGIVVQGLAFLCLPFSHVTGACQKPAIRPDPVLPQKLHLVPGQQIRQIVRPALLIARVAHLVFLVHIGSRRPEALSELQPHFELSSVQAEMVRIVNSVASQTAAGSRDAVIVDEVLDIVVKESCSEGQRSKVLNDSQFIFPCGFGVQCRVVRVGAPRPPVVVSRTGETV